MASPVKLKTERFDASKYQGLSRDQLIRIYRTMFLSRQIDDREIQLKRQNKIFFQISGAGHEAVLVAAGLVLKSGYDWFFPYYRDRALALMVGETPYEMMLQGGGRKGRSRVRRAPDAVALGQSEVPSGHRLFADGNALAARRGRRGGFALLPGISQGARTGAQGSRRRVRQLRMAMKSRYVSGGEGATSEGEFFEALNAASLQRLPVLFLVEDNGYAISVPVEYQTAGGNISQLVRNFPHFHIEECDGTDPLESYEALSRAVAHCRARTGPALVHAHVTRPYSHSLSDDEKLYKTAEEREAEAQPRSAAEIRAVSGARRHSGRERDRSARGRSGAGSHRSHRSRARRGAPAARFDLRECLFAGCRSDFEAV